MIPSRDIIFMELPLAMFERRVGTGHEFPCCALGVLFVLYGEEAVVASGKFS